MKYDLEFKNSRDKYYATCKYSKLTEHFNLHVILQKYSILQKYAESYIILLSIRSSSVATNSYQTN